MNKTFWPTSNFITSSNKSLMKFVFSFFPPLEELKKKSVEKKSKETLRLLFRPKHPHLLAQLNNGSQKDEPSFFFCVLHDT